MYKTLNDIPAIIVIDTSSKFSRKKSIEDIDSIQDLQERTTIALRIRAENMLTYALCISKNPRDVEVYNYTHKRLVGCFLELFPNAKLNDGDVAYAVTKIDQSKKEMCIYKTKWNKEHGAIEWDNISKMLEQHFKSNHGWVLRGYENDTPLFFTQKSKMEGLEIFMRY